MKRFALPIQVSVAPNQAPTAFRWRQLDYDVIELLDHWRIQTRWWEETEERRDYYQVLARPAGMEPRPEVEGVYELYRRHGAWFMGAVVD